MTVWLNPDQVAERIGVARKTAVGMMHEMNPVFISGNVRKRMRVSEESLDKWMIAHSMNGKSPVSRISTGSKKRLGRR